MSREWKRCLGQPLYWAVLAAGLAARAVLAYFDGWYRGRWRAAFGVR